MFIYYHIDNKKLKKIQKKNYQKKISEENSEKN